MPVVKHVTASVDWQDYTGEKVILPVCVRSPAMQGRNLTASLQALSEKVTAIYLVLIDTLDRYNFNMDTAQCQARGKLWLEQNQDTLKEFVRINSVTQWEDVLSDPSFSSRLEAINGLYAQNRHVREMIDKNAMYFVNARKRRGEKFDVEAVFQNSVSYMIEEYAGTAVYGEWLNYLPEAYWGIYVGNPYFFEQYNTCRKSLRLPLTLPVRVSRLSPPFAGERAESKVA